MPKKVTPESRIDDLFVTCSPEEALRLYAYVQLIMKVRGLTPTPGRKKKVVAKGLTAETVDVKSE